MTARSYLYILCVHGCFDDAVRIKFGYAAECLSVIRVLAVLSQVMLIEQFLADAGQTELEVRIEYRHVCDFFKNYGILYCLFRSCSPCERTVLCDKAGRHFHAAYISSCESIDYRVTRIALIILRYHTLVKRHSAGNIAVEIISVGRTVSDDIKSRLRPDRSIARVGMYDASELLKRLIERDMCGSIRRGTEIALYHTAFHIYDYHFIGCKLIVRNA